MNARQGVIRGTIFRTSVLDNPYRFFSECPSHSKAGEQRTSQAGTEDL
jgi:hypothetical protein